jgi:hypothetical protein
MIKQIFIVALVISIAACSSRQTVETLKTTARAEADGIKTRAAAAYANSISETQDNYVTESKAPLLTGRLAPIERKLPKVFKSGYFFNPMEQKRLVDVVKILSSATGLIVNARDDVYNPTSTSINSTDDNGNIDANAAQLANEVRLETNLDVAGRVVIPEGSRYSGDVEGFLDYISSILNIGWEYIPNENRVLLTRKVQESYRLFVPPSSDAAEGDNSDIWGDTQESISQLLSQGGSVQVNQKAGIISVVDTKDVQGMVRKYLIGVNESLRKTVLFKLEILSYTATDFQAQGFNLDFLLTGADSAVSLSGPGGSIPGAASLSGNIIGSSDFSGTKLLQQNLAQKFEVNVSLSRLLRTMNNQSASAVLKDIVPVVSSYTPPIVSNGITTPGGVSTEDIEVGFDLNITPSIMDDGQNLAVRVVMNTSSIEEITDIPVGTDGQFVQSAKRRTAEYEHTFSIKNAETIVISGYSDRTNEFKQSNPTTGWLSWLFSSSQDSADRTYYVILLTPQVSNGSGTVI